MKILVFLISFITVVSSGYAEEENRKTEFYFESETTAEIGIRDKDDSANKDIGLDRNSPRIMEKMELFMRIIPAGKKRFIFGPYFGSELGLRFDSRETGGLDNFLERQYGFFDIGIKLGKEFGKKNLKDSYFLFTIPLAIDYRLHFSDIDNSLLIPLNVESDPVQYTDLTEYHTSYMLGLRPGFRLYLKMRDQYMRFNLEDYVTLQKEALIKNYTSDYSGIFFENKNILEYWFAPFNFINNKIDIWFKLYNRLTFSYDSYNIGLNDKIYFGIEWTGNKYVHIGWKPIQYSAGVKIPSNNNNGDAYDKEHEVSMELWVGAGYKAFWAELSYTPVLYGVDTSVTSSYGNQDSLRPHTFSLSIEIEI